MVSVAVMGAGRDGPIRVEGESQSRVRRRAEAESDREEAQCE